MSTPQDKSPQDKQGSTRIVAGPATAPKRPLGLFVGVIAGGLGKE